MQTIAILDFLARLGGALLLGALVGLERQWRQRMAGTRTNALVAAGASAFVMCAFLVGDPLRSEIQIVCYVVSGVGFLGAGVIFKDTGTVRGLNTAATIWCSAAVGAICGLGFMLHASAVASAVLLANVGLRPLAYRLYPASHGEDMEGEDIEATPKLKVTAQIRGLGRQDSVLEQIVVRLSLEAGVSSISWAVNSQVLE